MSFFTGLKSFLTPESKDAVEKDKYDVKKKPVAVSEPTATKIPIPPDVPDVDPKSFIDNREGGTEEKEIIVIKKTVVNIHKVLERNAAIESDSLKKKKKKKKGGILSNIGKKMLSPIKGAAFSIKGFLIKFIGGWLLINLLPHFEKLVGLFKGLVSILSWIGGFAKNLLVGLIEIVNAGANVYDWAYNNIEKTFGEGAAKAFEEFTGVFNNLAKLVVVAALMSTRLGLLGNIVKWAKKLFVKGAVKTAATTATTTATTTTAATGGTAAAGGTAATVGGVSAGVAAAAVAAAGALAVGLGEGIFALGKKGYAVEEDWKQKAEEKWWTDPRKYWWGIGAGMLGITNRAWSFLGGIFDIIGAPFRMLGDLIMFPFLSEEGKKKQKDNLVKYDTRIREQFRKFVNMFDIFGMVNDDEGSWGSIYGKAASEKASKEMGFEKNEKKKGGGFKRMVGGAADFMTGGMWDFDKKNRKGAPKDWGIRRIAGGVADWATMGITDFDKRGKGNLQVNPMFGGKDKAWGSRNEQAKRGEKQSGMGIKRGIGGALDFATLGTFDFDKQNPTGSPKDWGLLRMMGGITDAMTGGLTDFDKRGRGILQVNPLSGGRDRRWGKEMQRPSRSRRRLGMSEYYPLSQPRAKNRTEIEEYIKNNPEAKGGTWTQVGDQWVLLTPKQVKERNDKLIKAAEGGSKYAQSLLDFDGIKPKNDVSLKSNNISEYPSYDDEGEVVTMIQPVIMEKSGKTQVIPVNSGSSGSSSGVNSNDTQHLRAGAA